VTGQRIRLLIDDEILGAGRHDVQWDGRDLQGRAAASGTYLYHLSVQPAGFEATHIMTLLK
jgi:hypothetical protein